MLREVGSGDTGPAWLTRLAPEAWIRQGLGELQRAEERLAQHDRTAGVLGLRRAAGMALNGALAVQLRDWGRTYIDHLRAIAEDHEVPEAVRAAAKLLNEIQLERQPNVVRLTPPSEGARWVEAAKTVMAHAYAVVHGSSGRP
jgi:HEPN domain-containing protein